MRGLVLAMALAACGGHGATQVDASAADSDGSAPGYTPLAYSGAVAGIENNPLKGFVPFAKLSPSERSSAPYSMEFTYVPLSQVFTAKNTIDWSSVETVLDAVAARGNHSILRFYLDYPRLASAIPGFLLDSAVTSPVVATYGYTAYGNTTSVAPDWNNADLIAALTYFAAAYGAKYDGDPRIGYVEVGLYGFWGEFHTSPYVAGSTSCPEYGSAGSCANFEMTDANKLLVLKAYAAAFTKTPMLFSQDLFSSAPLFTTELATLDHFGVHDDSFAYSTILDATNRTWYFWPHAMARNFTTFWMTKPTGGEIRPEIQPTVFDDLTVQVNNAQDIEACITTTHATWMMDSWVHDKTNNPTATQLANATTIQKMLGYELTVSQVRMPATLSAGAALDVSIKVLNKGVAPFYGNWASTLYAMDRTTKAVTSLGATGWDWRTILPSTTETELTFSSSLSLAAGAYDLLLRIENPLPNGHALRFANATQDQSLDGYLTLGRFDVQ